MSIFFHHEFDGHESVLFGHDSQSGLRAIIAIHNRNRGPAVGGCRFWHYEDEAAAVTDVLRLSKGMTYKSALAELPFGGGKSVIIADAKTRRSPELFRAMGRLIDDLGGSYVAAEDVGVGPAEVELIGQQTAHVRGIAKGKVGDPSPYTAYGVFLAVKASLREAFGSDSPEGSRLAIQGLGAVGWALAKQLHEAGAELIVSDLDQTRLDKAAHVFGAQIVSPEEILSADCDLLAPCALGAVLNDTTIPLIKAKVVAGAANNQLAEQRHAKQLAERGILYAPDYAANAGGIIVLSYEASGPEEEFDRPAALTHIGRIDKTLKEVYLRARSEGSTTVEAADRLAEERFGVSKIKAA